MRVFKKISTPFVDARPDKAIIVVNGLDPQINTIKAFIQACDEYKIGYTVFVNKVDKIDDEKFTVGFIKQSLDLKDIQFGSAKTSKGFKKLATYLDLWFGKRIIVLGVFNSGKTSLINKLTGEKLKVGDIPGTTLEFTEIPVNGTVKNIGKDNEEHISTVLIDSVGQLIDIHKPMMVSIDLSDCSDGFEKVNKIFDEEILGLVETKECVKNDIFTVVKIIKQALSEGNKIIVTGAGASALVAKEIAGQGTECGLPIMVFTNDGAELQPVTFSKGLGEQEGGLSKYIANAINPGDIVIGISASGGTGFVFDTLRRGREKKAITIAITENSDTPLGHAALYIIKSEAKPEGPSSSKIQTAHLVIGHALILTLADELGITADESVGYMLPDVLENKKMGIK